MFDKPAHVDADFFGLPDLSVVTLTGADAMRFAQAQFMNDVAALPAGQWQWNGWLTPKGRVVALFALIKRAEDDVVLLLLDAVPAEFCAALGRFVFRSKVKVAPCPALSVLGCFTAPKQAQGSVAAELEDRVLELDFGAEGGVRTLLLAAVGSFSAFGNPHPFPARRSTPGVQSGREAMPRKRPAFTPSPASGRGALDLWHRFDIAHGLPRLLPGQTGHWTPQQLSLDRLHAYSVKKGCYPGQEIVARTHFLGQAKRGLVRLRVNHAIAPNTNVQVDENSPIPLVAYSGNEALAVLPLDATPDALYRIGGHPVLRQPLLDGLAR